MFTQLINLNNDNEKSQNNAINLLEHFICCLENNGQILNEHLLVKIDNGYMLYVATPKSNSLNSCFDSIYVKKDRNALAEIFTITVKQIGINPHSQEYCSCGKKTAIEMQTFANDVDSVFTCCACGKPIALYELPYLDRQDDHCVIVNWQNTYRATDTLWLESLSDRFTGNQLVKVDSVLNKNGREIANDISRKTERKCYYNIFDDLTKKVKFTKVHGKTVRICPSCERAMKYVKFCDNYERCVCDDCNLSSGLPKDELSG